MRRVFRILINKFFIASAFFAVWMIFFDQNSWLAQQERQKELDDADRNIAYMHEEIARMEAEHKALATDSFRVEQYARERYKMKRDNEDLYVIER